MQQQKTIISDRIRLAIALIHAGYTPNRAASRAQVAQEELDYWAQLDRRGLLPKERSLSQKKMN